MTTSTLSLRAAPNPLDSIIAAAIFALAALWLVIFAQGEPSYDPDGAFELNIARNVAAGKGFVTNWVHENDIVLKPRPTTTKPPLYAASSGLLIWLGLSPERAAWMISGGAWAVSAALLFLIARQVLPLRYALLVPIFPALQVTSLHSGINIHEQSLFVALVLATLWRLTLIVEAGRDVRWGQFTGLGLLAGLTILASYQGLPLIIVSLVCVLISARRRDSARPLVAFCFGLAAVGVWPLIRFVLLWLSVTRPGFDVYQGTTYYKMLAGIASAFQNDVLGRLVVWLYKGSLKDVIVLILFYAALAALLAYAAWRRRAFRPLAAFFALQLLMLVVVLGGFGKDAYEPRANTPLYGLFFLFVIYAVYSVAERWRWPVAGTGLCVLALALLSYGQILRYPEMRRDRGGYCPAPIAIGWIKRNVPSGSLIASTQCGYQLLAESNAYFWLAIPPATDVRNPERWDEARILSTCKFGAEVWVVLLGGVKKDPFRQEPGYGPYVEGLFDGQPTARTRPAARMTDGMVYRLDCEASGPLGK